MSNRHRGEVSITLGSKRYALRLTLQALAEIEAAFGASDLAAMGARFAGGKLAARDLVVLTGATIRGGGHDIDDREIANLINASEISTLVEALADLFTLSFGQGTTKGGSARP